MAQTGASPSAARAHGDVTAPPGVPAVWGVLNVTPDSFSDGGKWLAPEAAVEQGLRLLQDGADVLDIGGESTRPGAAAVSLEDELARVVPVVAALRRAGVRAPLSVDTRNAPVARAALDAGATIVNDVSAGRHDPGMFPLVAERQAGLVLMHMLGEPETMQRAPAYRDVVADVLDHLLARRRAATEAGIAPERLWLDPGIGFGKTLEHNLALLQALERFAALGPVLLGASRKSFLGALTGRLPAERLIGSLACVARGTQAGVAAVRVHDVRETRELLAVLGRIGPMNK